MRDFSWRRWRASMREMTRKALGVGEQPFFLSASKIKAFEVSDFRTLPVKGEAVRIQGEFMIGFSAIGGRDPVA